jgi:hypothetical protein
LQYIDFGTMSAHSSASALEQAAAPEKMKFEGLEAEKNLSVRPTLSAPSPPFMNAVSYAPHLIGQAYGTGDDYINVFRRLHVRDLKLLKNHVKADTIMLKPWNTEIGGKTSEAHSAFISTVINEDLKVIPTFKLSSYYALMSRDNDAESDVTPDLSQDFKHFVTSLDGLKDADNEHIQYWTTDITVSIGDLVPWPTGTETELEAGVETGNQPCGSASYIQSKNPHFNKYYNLLKSLSDVATESSTNFNKYKFLLPLDLDTIGAKMDEAANVMTCMSKPDTSGWGMHDWFRGDWNWLLHMSLPLSFTAPQNKTNCSDMQNFVQNAFTKSIQRLPVRNDQPGAVVMVGTSSTRKDTQNQLRYTEDYGNSNAKDHGQNTINGNIQQCLLSLALSEAKHLQATQYNIVGFMVDEWSDDWDRGRYGPFMIADDYERTCGGRYRHDAINFDESCVVTTPLVTSGDTSPATEFYGLNGQYTIGIFHCITPRYFQGDADGARFTFGNTTIPKGSSHGYHCDVMVPSTTWTIILGILITVATGLHVASWRCRKRYADRVLPTVPGLASTVMTSTSSARDQPPTETQLMKQHKKRTTVLAPDSLNRDEARQGPEAEVEVRILSELIPELARDSREQKWSIKLVADHLNKDILRMVLKAHLESQKGRLEKQIKSEILYAEAYEQAQQRSTRVDEEGSHDTGGGMTASLGMAGGTFNTGTSLDERKRAESVRTIHSRVLEGFNCWCEHVGSPKAKEIFPPDQERPTVELYCEALLQRILESVGEHMINTPERVSYILEQVLDTAKGADGSSNGKTWTINYDKLQDGLQSMMKNANPYKGGLNFDDINDCGIMKIPKVRKTFREPRNLMVVLDFILCYRTVLAIKLYCFLFAIYLYMGSGLDGTLHTSNNGTWLQPQWERVNLIQYSAAMDAVLWGWMQMTQFCYRTWQRYGFCTDRLGETLGRKSLHLVGFILSMAGLFLIIHTRDIRAKPDEVGEPDPRCGKWYTFCGANYALAYWAMRIIVFKVSHMRKTPMHVFGKPERLRTKQREQSAFRERMQKDFWTGVTWFIILAACIVFEAYMVLPLTSGMDTATTCGVNWNFAYKTSAADPAPPVNGGSCTDSFIRSDCASCVISVISIWWLVLIGGAALDMYFFFYIFAAVVGFVMGHRRGLNNFKNTMKSVDLINMEGMPGGNEAKMMYNVFGPAWREVWFKMIEGLYEEDLIDDSLANEYALAAGIDRPDQRRRRQDSDNFATADAGAGTGDAATFLSDSGGARPDMRPAGLGIGTSHSGLSPLSFRGSHLVASFNPPSGMRPIELNRAPEMAGERLVTFFISLASIVNPPSEGCSQQTASPHEWRHERDALTSCHAGTIPSLTQIIPAYNEVVIPSVAQLKRGADPKYADNQENKKTRLRTDQAVGDGLNTNLGFIVSQRLEEWVFLAKRLRGEETNVADDILAKNLFNNFMSGQLEAKDEMEVRYWAAMRMQTVGKTVIGALQYSRALRELPNIQDHYQRARAETGLESGVVKLGPKDHSEVVLAHQTFGSKDGKDENDNAVLHLLNRYKNMQDHFFLVFDYQAAKAKDGVRRKVEEFLREQYREIYDPACIQYASCKAVWDDLSTSISIDSIKLIEVLPRRFPLRIGSSGFMTQGKASNQLNGLRFATGHVVQAMDANMGVFIGEAYKIPFAMRRFLPLNKKSRTEVTCRYIGFRERIFTYDDGLIGRCHASAEWTFGTIFQRFLSGIGARMHYGHPDFVDGFWASNRGGMSKCSPSVNLSEDIFAGFNCKMREEKCPHIDYLEFLKGREASLIAASNFFAKISGGSVAMMRSRDLHLICENIGVLHAFSFYFASTAFYMSNLAIDVSIYLYVILFIVFTLASQSISSLNNLGSTLSMEWIVALGILCGVPQLFELILELGPAQAFLQFGMYFIDTCVFFMFQNKTIASAIKLGAVTGKAPYFFTGRPLANQHYTWRDAYITYWASHYYPAFSLLLLVGVYHLLTGMNSEGTLPMVMVITSAVIWIIAPVLFLPFPNLRLIQQDLAGFWQFITSPVPEEQFATGSMIGTAHQHQPSRSRVVRMERAEQAARKMRPEKIEDVRCLQEYTLGLEIKGALDTNMPLQICFCLLHTFISIMIVLVIPANILDFLYVFLICFAMRWLLMLLTLSGPANNLVIALSYGLWFAVPLYSDYVIGDRGGKNIIEFAMCFLVFMSLMSTLRRYLTLFARVYKYIRIKWAMDKSLDQRATASVTEDEYKEKVEAEQERMKTIRQQHDAMIRSGYYMFLKADIDTIAAIVVLLMNLVTALALVVFECGCILPRGLHTWWLLNSNVAHAAVKKSAYVPGKTHTLPVMTHCGSGASGGTSGGQVDSSAGSRAVSSDHVAPSMTAERAGTFTISLPRRSNRGSGRST